MGEDELLDRRRNGLSKALTLGKSEIYQLLIDAFDAVPEGIALFDAEDRYVMWNQRYAEIYGPIAETIAVGARFEDVVRAGLKKGLVPEAVGREEEWLAERLAEHHQSSHTSEYSLSGNKWIRVDERRTRDGGRVGVRTDITELKQRDASFRLLFEANPIPMFVCHAETLAFLAVNDAAVHHYGYAREQLLSMSVHDLRRPDDREDLRQRTLTGVAGRQTGRIRPHVKADGSQIYVSVYSTSMTHDSQPAVVVAAIDVTARIQAEAERKGTEAKLREQKLQLDTAISNMVQGLLMFDADERVALVNQRYIEMYGLSPDIVKVGCSALDLLTHRKQLGLIPGDPKVRLDENRVRSAEGKPWGRILELPDGRTIQVVHGSLPNGGRLSTHDDITERQQAEAERLRADVKIREQKLQLDAAVDNMVQGLVMFDADGRVALWNQRYIEIYGVSPGILKERCTFLELMKHRKDLGVFDGDPEEISRRNSQSLAMGKPWSLVHELPDGRSIKATQRSMPNGGWVSTHDDITERQQSEAERLRADAKIREQKLQLDTAIENMVHGLVMFDADERLVLWNNRYVEIYGLSLEIVRVGCPSDELMKHRMDLGVFPEEPDKYTQERNAHRSEGKPWVLLNKLQDGRIIRIVHRFLAGGGRVTTHADITTRVQSEVKLREQKLQLDAAVDNMTQGLVMFDADDRMVVWNQRYIDLYGVSPKIMRVGCTHLELLEHRKELGTIAGDPVARQQTHLARLAEGKSMTYINDLPDGRSIQATNSPRAEGGWVSTHEDITERRQAEAKIHEQKLQLDAAVDNMVQGLVMFDAEARVVLRNRRYIDMYGLSPSVIREGCTHLELLKHRKEKGLFSGDPEARSRQALAHVATKETWSHVNVLPDGRSIHSVHGPLPNGGWVSTHEDITERVLAQKQIEHLAHHDVLTTLPNRASFNLFLSNALEKTAQQKSKIAVLCIDLDRLKEVNDVFGHAAGDGLLKKVAERLTSIATGAFVARLGGDEFGVVVTDVQQPESTADLAKRSLAAIAEEIDLDGQTVVTNSSIGIATYPNDGADAASLLANGDAALYRAKREGRGRICFFDADMDKQLRKRRTLQHELRLAIESDEVTLVYQPQARVTTEIVGFEALARWRHPTRGTIGPDVFIPLTEDSGLIMRLGERLLRQACREAATWDRQLQIAVNLSPVQFIHGDLPGLVHSVLLETGLAPQRLELKITEGILIDDFSRATSILRRLKALGVKIAMDDFGTGYSSLSYLRSVPLDKIKIDRSFIAELDDNHQSSAIIRAVIGLAHDLSLSVLVEGVETKKQLAFLKQENCDEIQGFLVGRPRSIDDYAMVVGAASHTSELSLNTKPV